MLQPNVQYVVRFWNTKLGTTLTKIADEVEIKRMIKEDPITNIRVWELETNDLKKVSL